MKTEGYYLGSNGLIYYYNPATDHYLLKSPKPISREIKEPDFYKSLGKSKADKLLNEQYKDIEEIWEYNGEQFKSGKNFAKDSLGKHIKGKSHYEGEKYALVYYRGGVFQVEFYRADLDLFVLKNMRSNKRTFYIHARHCSPIYEILRGRQLEYGINNEL